MAILLFISFSGKSRLHNSALGVDTCSTNTLLDIIEFQNEKEGNGEKRLVLPWDDRPVGVGRWG